MDYNLYDSYSKIIKNHYTDLWLNKPNKLIWKRGPFDKISDYFEILEFPPSSKRDMWTYATCCMSHIDDISPIELHIFSSKQDESIAELLTSIAYYHRNTASLDLHHTVNFGRPWQESSKCSYGLISLPYLDGPNLENCKITNKIIKFYWLIPITKNEVSFKVKFGIDALEDEFDKVGLNYILPYRESVV